MKKLIPVFITIVLVFIVVAPGFASKGETNYIVVFREDSDPEQVAKVLRNAYDLEVAGVYKHALKGAVVSAKKNVIDKLAQDEKVVMVEEEQFFYVDVQEMPTGIERIFADDNGSLSIDGADDYRVNADVAVLDTGIDFDHPDLNLYTTINCTWGGPRAGSCSSSKDDGHGHGTHVAGIIGALDNNDGVVGVAPGVRLWGVKVLTNWGFGTTTQIVAGIDYVAAHADQIEVANMSLGGMGESPVMDTAITNAVSAGVVFVVSAGNAATDVANYHPGGSPSAITVSALADYDGLPGGIGVPTCRDDDDDDTLALFSNYGAGVDIAAPGFCILSTYKDGSYATMSGTSMAAPYVTGAAAILLSSNDSYTPADVKAALVNSGNFNWTDDAYVLGLDEVHEPLLDLSDPGLFLPGTLSMVEGDVRIELEGTPYTKSGVQHTDLVWSGARTAEVDIHRDGVIIATVSNTGAYTDRIGDLGAGYHGYIVCESGSTVMCSQPIFLEY